MNPADILKYGDKFLRDCLDGLPESAWETGGVCGVWSVRDILAHLAAYEGWLQEVLAPFAGVTMDMPEFTRMGEIGPNAWNDDSVARRQGMTPAQTLAQYDAIFRDTQARLVPLIPAEVWPKVGTIPWYGAEYALDDFIVYAFYGHKREHGAQIAAFKDQFR